MNEIRQKYIRQLNDLAVEAMYYRSSDRNVVLVETLEKAAASIEELIVELAMAQAATRAASCEIVRLQGMVERLNEAVARIAKDRDEAVAKIARLERENLGQSDLIARLEKMAGEEDADHGEAAVCGNAGGTGEEAGPGDGTAGG